MTVALRKPKDRITSVRAPLAVLKQAKRAARMLKITKNAFMVRAMAEKAEAVLAEAAQTAAEVPLAKAS